MEFDKKLHLLLFGLLVLILLSPVLIKSDVSRGVFTSEETYHNLLLKEMTPADFSWDVLFFNNLFHVFLSWLPFEDFVLVVFIPLLAGLLSVVVLFFLLREINLSDNEIILVILLFVLTPVFLSKFTSLNPDSFALFFLLLTILLYFKGSLFIFLSAFFLFLLSPLYSFVFFLFLLIMIFLKRKKDLSTLILALVSFFVVLFNLFVSKSFYLKIRSVLIDDVFIELGGLNGYSIPLVILCAIGIFVWWERGREKNFIVLGLFFGFFISLFFQDLRLVFALPLAIFAGIGINYLLTLAWELVEIKQSAVLLIFCIVIFSAIVTISALVNKVSVEEVDASKFLSSVSGNGLVLSTEDKGFMIQYFSSKKTFIDGNSYLYDDFDDKLSVLDGVFYARRLSELESLLSSNFIEFVFVYEGMKEGEVWSSRDEGLQFFLANSDRFLILYDSEFVQIYRYINVTS